MTIHDLSALPGGDLVMQGLRDLHDGHGDTACALLVRIGRPRLTAAGLDVPAVSAAGNDAEILLYERLAKDGTPDPYAAYNSLIRRLVSCEAALEQQLAAARRVVIGPVP